MNVDFDQLDGCVIDSTVFYINNKDYVDDFNFKRDDDVLDNLSTKSRYVGKLNEKWRFSSDHLPVGTRIAVDAKSGFNIVSWNVLNTEYMHWIEQGSIGLENSILMQEHYVKAKPGLTLRDLSVISHIKNMINDEKDPKSVLLLQECGWDFTIELMAQLQHECPFIQVVKHTHRQYTKDQNLILYDTRQFNFVVQETTYHEFLDSAEGQCRPFMNLLLQNKENKRFYRFYNVHLPGNPEKDAPRDLAIALKKRQDDKEVSIVAGDMNFDRETVRNSFNAVFGKDKSFEYHLKSSDYCTNISPITWQENPLHSKCIDHIYVRDIQGDALAPLSPQEVLKDESFFETLKALHSNHECHF